MTSTLFFRHEGTEASLLSNGEVRISVRSAGSGVLWIELDRVEFTAIWNALKEHEERQRQTPKCPECRRPVEPYAEAAKRDVVTAFYCPACHVLWQAVEHTP